MKLRPFSDETTLAEDLRPYQADYALSVLMWLPVWMGILWTFVIAPPSGTPTFSQQLLQGMVVTILFHSAICLMSYGFAVIERINHKFGGFKLYRTWWERNVRGYVMCCYRQSDELPIKIEVISRWSKIQLPKDSGCLLWVSLDSYFPRRGGLLHKHSKHCTWLTFWFHEPPNTFHPKILMAQSNGSMAVLSLEHALRFAEAYAKCRATSHLGDVSSIEQALNLYFQSIDATNEQHAALP